ncbi:MAG: sulfite exporter TauE/SafE family protein, partial [Peptococcaceae bacterium]|nr:sulfite exporter TauE/SafE family protein [Peptococcaceae bacterium]
MPDLFFPILLCATFAAAFVQGITGFAFTMIFLACMQSFLPYTELLAIATVLAIFMLSMNVYVYRHHIVWKWLPLPLLINCVVTVAAIRLLRQTMDFPYWHQLLGIVFILLAVYMYLFQKRIQIKPTMKNALLFCGAGGILGGLFGVGGPPIVLYFLALTDSKERYLSSTQMFFWFNMLYDFAGRA